MQRNAQSGAPIYFYKRESRVVKGRQLDKLTMGISIYDTTLPERQLSEYLQLLETCGLRDEGDADIIALMTEDDRLVACGALAGHTVKQLAVAPDAEGQGAMAAVLSALISEAYARGVHRLFLCTKPENLRMFGSMGFHIVIETKDAVLLENRKGGLDSFLESIPKYDGVCCVQLRSIHARAPASHRIRSFTL